jgi:hypothetical protein
MAMVDLSQRMALKIIVSCLLQVLPCFWFVKWSVHHPWENVVASVSYILRCGDSEETLFIRFCKYIKLFWRLNVVSRYDSIWGNSWSFPLRRKDQIQAKRPHQLQTDILSRPFRKTHLKAKQQGMITDWFRTIGLFVVVWNTRKSELKQPMVFSMVKTQSG